MLIGRLQLPFPDRFDRRILRRAYRALRIFVCLVQAALVKGVLAEKVDCREIQITPARGAATGLEDGGFASEFLYFFSFCIGFRGVAGY